VLEPDPELAVAYGIFSARQAAGAGYSRADIKRQLRRESWVRLHRGIFSVAGREARATDGMVIDRLAAGPGAVVGYGSAATVHGWELRTTPRQTKLIVPPTSARTAGFRARLDGDDVELRGVLPVTAPLRTALDIACTTDFEEAVIALDSALRSGGVTYGQLCSRFRAARCNGVPAARLALDAADARSGSVIETQARLLFARAGLPKPTSQFLVRSPQGRPIARVDFAWEGATLAVEIDGFAYHSAGGDFQRDRRRQNWVQIDGWLILRFTAADIRTDPDYVIEVIRLALARRLG
jgi:hypothetical protein